MAVVERNGLKYDEDALVARIYQDYSFAKAERDRHALDWQNARAQFNCEWTELQKKQDDEDLNQWFYVPKTLMAIHRLECEVTMQFFGPGQKKLGKISAANTNPTIAAAAEIVDQLVHAKVDIELRPYRALYDSWHRGLIEGVGALKGKWDSRLMTDEQGNISPVNRASLEGIPNEHCCWDPYALSPEKVSYFCHEIWLTEDELWERFANGKYVNGQKMAEILAAASKEDNAASDTDWRLDRGAPGNQSRYLHKVIEYWGPQQLLSPAEVDAEHRKGKHTPAVDIVATIYANKLLLRCEKNTYAELFGNPEPFEKLPFWLCTPLPQTNSTYGYSLVLWGRPLQRETNLIRNQRRQAVEMEMSMKVFYDENRLTNLKALDSARYGGRVPVNGPPSQVVSTFKPQTSTQNMVQEEAMLDQEFQQLMGVTAMDLGAPSAADLRTATGAHLAAARGGPTKQTIVQNICMTGIVPVLEFFTACAIKYCSPEEVQEIIQSFNPMPVALKDVIRNMYHVELEAGVDATSKDAEIQKIMAAINANAQAANAAPQAAIPALALLNRKLMELLGQNQAAAYWAMTEQGFGQGQSPAGQQMTAMPNSQAQGAVMQQGRTPTPNETGRV